MTKALILGIEGMDGGHMSEFLMDKDYEIFGTYFKSYTPNKNTDVTCYQLDINDTVNLRRIIELVSPDEIYNFAGISSKKTEWSDPLNYLSTNGTAVVNLLEIVKEVDRNIKLFQANSSEMFQGHPPHTIINERTDPRPVSPYGLSKLVAHYACEIYRKKYSLYCCSGILFIHESHKRTGDFLVKTLVEGVIGIKKGTQEKIDINNILSARDWGSAETFTEAFWLCLQQPFPRDYVIATSFLHSVKDLFEIAFEEVGIKNWDQYVLNKNLEMENALIGDFNLLQSTTGWYPKKGIRDVIKEMISKEICL